MKILVRALIRWSWLLLLCLLAGYFGGKELSVLLPPTYQVTALVQLNASGRASQIIQPVAAYATLVTSDPVLLPVLKGHRDVDRQNFISKELVVTPDTQAQTISIQVTLPSAKEAVQIANALAQQLVVQQNAYIKSQYDRELQILTGRINNEQKAIVQLNQQLAKTAPTDTATVQQLNSQITQQQNLQNQDISSQQSLLTEQALYSTPFSLVQAATIPSKPSSLTGLIPLTPLTLAVLLIVGLVAISFFERSSGRINNSRSVQQKTNLPVLGSLRWTGTSPENIPLQRLGDAKSPYVEDCRVMMADVLFHAEEAGARILAVAGFKERAGCSVTATQLAVLLAQSKRRVLLIDANLRKPSVHERLKLSNTAGVGDILEEIRNMKVNVTPRQDMSMSRRDIPPPPLTSQKPVSLLQEAEANVSAGQPPFRGSTDEVAKKTNGSFAWPKGAGRFVHIKGSPLPAPVATVGADLAGDEPENNFQFNRYILATNIPNLYAIPAGKSISNPSSMLSMPEVGRFLQWAARPIDFVVIDCPALTQAETHVLGALSNQMLLVVDATRDRLKQVVQAKDVLLSTGVKISGLIVNKLERWV